MIQAARRLRPKAESDGKHSRDEMVEQKQEWFNAVISRCQLWILLSSSQQLPTLDREEKLKYEPIGMVTLKHCVD